jgi:hypothetical protein
VWIFAKRDVVERILARSKGVLSFEKEKVKHEKKEMVEKRSYIHYLDIQ